jgi:hypothetical protein
MVVRVLPSAAGSHHPTFLKSVMICSSSYVSDNLPMALCSKPSDSFLFVFLTSLFLFCQRYCPFKHTTRAGWALKLVWTLWRIEKCLALARSQTMIHWFSSALVKSPYWLNNLGSCSPESGNILNILNFPYKILLFGTCRYSDDWLLDVKYHCVVQLPYKIIPWCYVVDCIFWIHINCDSM